MTAAGSRAAGMAPGAMTIARVHGTDGSASIRSTDTAMTAMTTTAIPMAILNQACTARTGTVLLETAMTKDAAMEMTTTQTDKT